MSFRRFQNVIFGGATIFDDTPTQDGHLLFDFARRGFSSPEEGRLRSEEGLRFFFLGEEGASHRPRFDVRENSWTEF